VAAYDPTALPPDLPAPEDDGAARHLRGARVPPMALPATDGSDVVLAEAGAGERTVLFAYPRTGRPREEPLSPDWDRIPGARGCTPESCGFRDHHLDMAANGARVFGLSTQDTAYQREAVERLRLPFSLLSDDRLRFTRALDLPTFRVAGQVLLKRLTLVLRDSRVEHVFYPVFPPDAHAAEVLAWLRANQADVAR
jgi:peroxiredoxin